MQDRIHSGFAGGGVRPPVSMPRRPSGAHTSTYRSSGTRRPSPPSSSARRTSSGRPQPPSGARRPSGGSRPRPAPNGRRPTPPRRRAPRRRFRLRPVPLILLACAIALIAYAIHFASVLGIGTPTFIGNLSIEGTALSGLTYEEGGALISELEEQWKTETYSLSYQDQSWTFSRGMVDADADYETQLDYAWNLGHTGSIFQRKNTIDYYAGHPYDFEVTVTYDESLLDAFIDEICAALDEDAVNAVVVPDVSGPVVVTEAQIGLNVNREQLKEQLVALIVDGEADTAIPAEAVMPEVNTGDASFQVIAEFSTDTDFRGSSSLHNIRLALNAFNGMVVMPGQQVSFNDVVGPRTQAAGFRQATEYAGDTTTTGWGGGVCQASTTLYNALVIAGMDIVERSPHSMTVSYVDPSCDAAVSWTNKDLVFQNNTEHPIYIYTSVTDEEATVTVYGHRPDYRYELVSVLIEEDVPSTRVVYIEDTEGTHAYYTDETALQSRGKSGCVSEGWIIAYDWDTGAEVSRTQVSTDHYSPGASTYWIGVHGRLDAGGNTDY